MTVKPEDNGKALKNPDMGWFLAYYTDDGDTGFGARLKDGDTLDWFPGCNGVSFRIGWGRVEPGDGRFDWSYTDKIADKWIAAGKQIGLNWITFSTAGTKTTTPYWISEKGGKGKNFPGNNFFIPNWDDPLFTREYENFLKEAGKRYDGRRHLAFVEVGSLGTWGEGHNWTPSGDIAPIPQEVKLKHLEMYRSAFPIANRLVNDDYIEKSPNPGELTEAAKRLDYGMADWSLMVNHRDFTPAARLADQFSPRRPILLEHHHYGDAVKQGWWGDGEELLRAVERFRASMMRIHWFPDEFLNGNGKELKGNRALVDRINRRIGYRLQVREARWPDKAKPGGKADFVVSMRNGGVAPCYPGRSFGWVAITLKDRGGKAVAASVCRGEKVGVLEPAPSADRAPVRDFPVTVPLPNLPPGEYGVFVSVGDESGKPIFQLPHSGNDGTGRYRLGAIKIAK